MTDYEKFQQWLNDCPVKILDYQDFSDQFQITFEVELEEELNDWKEMLDAALGEEECGDAIGGDERSIATAAFASSALLHKDLDYSPVCDWLESGEGNPTPTASSTLWLIEISGGIESDDRQRHANQIRTMLGEESILEYGVISDDLISNDINESTLDNLVWLIFLAVIVVVLLLALTFRSATMVVAPLVALQ